MVGPFPVITISIACHPTAMVPRLLQPVMLLQRLQFLKQILQLSGVDLRDHQPTCPLVLFLTISIQRFHKPKLPTRTKTSCQNFRHHIQPLICQLCGLLTLLTFRAMVGFRWIGPGTVGNHPPVVICLSRYITKTLGIPRLS